MDPVCGDTGRPPGVRLPPRQKGILAALRLEPPGLPSGEASDGAGILRTNFAGPAHDLQETDAMFGYVVANIDDLDDEEKARYRAVYCGLCRVLKERGGQRSRVCLTYDLTFLVMLYNSLYEPEEDRGALRCRCIPRPGSPTRLAPTPATPPTSRSRSPTTSASTTGTTTVRRAPGPGLRRADQEGLPGRVGPHPLAVRRHRARLRGDAPPRERAHTPPDAVGMRFGALLGDLMAHGHDLWVPSSTPSGTALGQFIYLMDAAVDYEDDRKSGSYNPLVAMGSTPEGARDALVHLIGATVAAFERLPLEQDVHIMRSVLYDGVWNAFEKHYGTQVGTQESEGDGDAAAPRPVRPMQDEE